MAVTISEGIRVLGGTIGAIAVAPVAITVASLGFLAVHSYRGLGVAGNFVRSINQIKTDEEFMPATFGQKLQTPLKSTYNNYAQFVNAAVGREVFSEWAGNDHNPHPLDPSYDRQAETNYDFELTKGLSQAKNVVIDFINSGGVTYPITLESGTSAQSYLDTRAKIIADIAQQIQAKTSSSPTASAINLVSLDLTNTTEALADFQHYMKAGLETDPSKLFDYLQSLHNKIESELTRQLENDKNQITNLYTSNVSLRNEMIKTLTESHEKQLKELNEKIAADKVKLQEAVRKENERVFFLAHVIRQNPDLIDVFKTLSAEAKLARTPTGPNASTSATISSDATISFYGIDPAKIDAFKAFGATISKNDKNEYTLALPYRFWPSNFGLEDKTKHSIVMLVKTIKATSGSEKIKLSVEHPDPVHALYLARKMFEACREEGYKEEDITIVCNKKTLPVLGTADSRDKDGKEIKGEQGLLRNETAQDAINKKAAAFTAMREHNFNKLKTDIQAARLAEKTVETLIDEQKATAPSAPQ